MSSLTVYPAAGANSPVDGHIEQQGAISGAWSTTRDAVNGTSVTDTAAFNYLTVQYASSRYAIDRMVFLFDTSSLPDTAIIDSATLSFYGEPLGINNDSVSLGVVSVTPASDAALALGDYDKTKFGTTEFATRIPISSWGAQYNDFVLNASGLTNISKTGLSRFGLRFDRDLDNVAPTGNNTIGIYFADQTGNSKDPKLTITYHDELTSTILETTTLTETATATKGFSFSILETATITDTVSNIKGQLMTFLETFSLTDTISGLLNGGWTRQTKNTATLTNQQKH